MPRSPTKGRPPRLTFADLRAATIDCMMCGKLRPADGAKQFRAHHVCATCVPKVLAAAAARQAPAASK